MTRINLITLSLLSTLSLFSCTKKVYPSFAGSMVNADAYEVVNDKLGISFTYGYDRTIIPELFYYPVPDDNKYTIFVKGFYNEVITDIPMSATDSIIFSNPFMVCTLRQGNIIPDYDVFYDITNKNTERITRGSGKRYYEDHYNRALFVFEKYTLNKNKQRFIISHYVPYGDNFICFHYILQSNNGKFKNNPIRIYTTNFDITDLSNLKRAAEYFEIYLETTFENTKRIQRIFFLSD